VRVAVLRDTRAVPSELERRVDHAVASTLEQDGGIQRVELAPVPLAEVRLAAGCHRWDQRCATRVASVLKVDILLVRRLDGSAGHGAVVTFISHERHSRSLRAMSQAALAHDGRNVESEVRSALRILYGLPPRAQGEG
jgi:hypothetical protein